VRFVSRTNLCFGLAILGYLFLLILITLTVLHVVIVIVQNREAYGQHPAKLILLVLGTATFAAQVFICRYIPILAYVLLAIAVVLHLFEQQLRIRPMLTPSLNRLLRRRRGAFRKVGSGPPLRRL
jgi:hypothetical protein